MMNAVMIRLAKARGMRIFQAKVMSWSKRTRGKVHLNHMIMKMTKYTLMKNQAMPGRKGPCQPPRKKTVAMAATMNMLVYSARKNKAKRMPEYSVWKPATSSLSASGRSKGARLVSAVAQVRYRIKARGWTRTNQ